MRGTTDLWLCAGAVDTVVSTSVEESVLSARTGSSTAAHCDVIRARIVLAAACGVSNNFIAAGLGLHVDTCRATRRPAVFTPVQVAEVKALACTLPAETGAPLSRFLSADLAGEAITRGVTETISAATVRRWLGANAIKPWQHRSWIFPRDPDFAFKAARSLTSMPAGERWACGLMST